MPEMLSEAPEKEKDSLPAMGFLDHLEELPNGMYILQLYNGEKFDNLKMFIRH